MFRFQMSSCVFWRIVPVYAPTSSIWDFQFSTSLPALANASHFHFSRSSGCVVVSLCAFILISLMNNGIQPLFMFTDHLFGEVPVYLGPFFIGLSSLYGFIAASLVRCMYWEFPSPFSALPFYSIGSIFKWKEVLNFNILQLSIFTCVYNFLCPV